MSLLDNIQSFFFPEPKKISGIVVRGKGRGAPMGFPTANIPLSEDIAKGIYAGKAFYQGKEYKAAIYIGEGIPIAEVYLFDFYGDLYGEKIEVEIGKKLRDPIKFDSDEAAKAQIAADLIKIKEM